MSKPRGTIKGLLGGVSFTFFSPLLGKTISQLTERIRRIQNHELVFLIAIDYLGTTPAAQSSDSTSDQESGSKENIDVPRASFSMDMQLHRFLSLPNESKNHIGSEVQHRSHFFLPIHGVTLSETRPEQCYRSSGCLPLDCWGFYALGNLFVFACKNHVETEIFWIGSSHFFSFAK